ncbi:MAG TPA: 2-amino-4-hydroxy-6-hydroxymethyldihydropteridine diphosphokinase [Firmicutes bacterium]|uniref:2-amino-4-hydroxy-6-hydroxymethyldihydropteridine diphosphokinase n=1 Tax=Candidatus Coatesbacteria bacterium 4484_99 TaxID=1970774 RepID=A0A1W9S161_9BACT|nr:MAG: 2-amino-4-hydroxy-6-hydroxymethyldihydropteridine diphosphokinase [Candidatus Coatesbacteria bacterium 4484_99]RLC42699.1 MAG: 2-amino-4-hydroxy-6-hydroxymethyldihydropteridine diphosphokinase [Candidatus Coatesbacteria bacterium]HDM43363.1 2-amino-4-hydroxy-6-hydroxymethyldihydropteridine diphosphokinase [Bacillota bacterium]RLC42718.1 MAG: 2-amino-4-hydroxy-6-hydroxymethyldihydropteridine diphosphokinase [Candidatus Coatesbacteria bacterium]RLC43285.1 MAG: 2-amino-4-hydroxy-6-hydroxym
MGDVYIGFGSNRDDHLDNLMEALKHLGNFNLIIDRCSSVYATEGVDSGKGMPEFYNMVASFETTLGPKEVLSRCQYVEKLMGKDLTPLVARKIDLDLLYYGNLIICEDNLILPHPLAHRRRFVVIPMVEIAPDFVHPVMGLTMSQLNEKLPEEIGYVNKVKEIM